MEEGRSISSCDQDQLGHEGEEVMLPGFRFHPTDEELVGFYLKRKIQHRPLSIEVIKQLDIYKYDPWDLPKMASIGEKEWYFYCPRDRKYRNSARPNRVTGAGFWKATGTDRPIYSPELGSGSKCIGLKKSLVFYKGRAAKGIKTDWMMHEFRLPSLSADSISTSHPAQKRLGDKLDHLPALNDLWAICRIFKKQSSTGQRTISHSWVSPQPNLISNNNNNNALLSPSEIHHHEMQLLTSKPTTSFINDLTTSPISSHVSPVLDMNHIITNISSNIHYPMMMSTKLPPLMEDSTPKTRTNNMTNTNTAFSSLESTLSGADDSSPFLPANISSSIFGGDHPTTHFPISSSMDHMNIGVHVHHHHQLEANLSATNHFSVDQLGSNSNDEGVLDALQTDDQAPADGGGYGASGFPFGFPLNMSTSEAWKPINGLVWDSNYSPCPSEMSTSNVCYSTNKN